MSWIHDTGYGPTLDHEGGVADVLEDGTDPGTPPDQLDPRVTGWRAACQCGWRGTQFYLRTDWPDTDYALAPEQVEQHCKTEWERHLHADLPVLAIHDLTQQITHAQNELAHAVSAARATDVSWPAIAEAADITSEAARARWAGRPQSSAPCRQSAMGPKRARAAVPTSRNSHA